MKVLKIIPFFPNENRLIEKAVAQDREAQHQLYQKFAPKMLAVCCRYIKDLQFAEDAMVNGFVKVFKNLESFKREGSFEGWIRRIMVRESIDFLRKKQFVVYDDDIVSNVSSESYAEIDEEAEFIQKTIDELPDGYKTVFVMYAIEGYKHHEIAEILNISESTSKSQLFKARKYLQERLKEQNSMGYGIR